MRRGILAFLLALTACAALADGPRKLKPGFNLFSKDQDIQLGKEAAAQVEQQMTIVRDADLNNYIRKIGAKLAATPEAGGFPYSFQVVSDKTINAFALPGGPAFVHTGLITAAENEAQIAGVLAHEISHVALRHGTNQASKANLIQLPAALAGAMAGGSGGMLGQLAQLGIGIGAGSVLLSFSRGAERDADLLGTRIMARVGYNPVEMARFFEKLEAQGGSRMPQFLSDHPNPGNRVKAVQNEIRYLPRAQYTAGDSAEFARMQKRVAALPPPPERPKTQQAGTAPLPDINISRTMREHRAAAYRISYPDNWQVMADQQSQGATLAPKEGLVGNAIGIGAVIGLQPVTAGQRDLRRDTDALVGQLASSNAGMKVQGTKDQRVNGEPALAVTLQSQSPFAGQTETDTLVTVERPEGLFYIVLIAPQGAASKLQSTFDAMLRSIRFVSQ